MGAQKQSFSCNPKHFFIATSLNKQLSIRCVWISKSKEIVDEVKAMGFEAYNLHSIKGIYICLKAGFYFVNCDTKDISFMLSNKTCFINMWHGIPLKKLHSNNEQLETESPKKLRDRKTKTFDKIFNPKAAFRYDYIVSTSKYVTNYSLSSVFDIDEERCLEVGYPRTDIFFKSAEEIKAHIARYDQDLLPILDWILGKRKVFLYAPTWRDTQEDFIRLSGINFKGLNSWLQTMDSVFIVKLHPYTKVDLSELEGLNSIRLLNKDSDIYPLLTYVDTLITDYSSIYFDFILLNRPIVFFPFDIKHYMKECRGLYFNYEDVTPGPIVYDYNNLISALSSEDTKLWATVRERTRNDFWTLYSGDASKNLVSKLLEL